MTLAAITCAQTHPDRIPRKPPVLLASCAAYAHGSEKMAVLIESVQEHPTSGAYNTLGALYAEKDKVACAITAFEAALNLDKQNWEAHYNLALALIRKGDRSRAERELQAAIQEKPDSVSSQFALGSLYESEGKLPQAEVQFRSASNDDPQFVDGALKLAEVLLAQHEPEKAVATLQKAITTTPAGQQIPLQAALGLAYADAGDTDRGLSTLKELTASHPDSAEAHFNLALLYSEKVHPPDLQSATTELGEALGLDPAMDSARLLLAQVLLKQKKYSDALPVAEEYTKRQPKESQGFSALGSAYEGLGGNDAATESLRKAAALAPNEAETRISLGALLAEKGKTEEAIQQFRVAEHLHPSDPEVHAELASLLDKAGAKQQARAERAIVAKVRSAENNASIIEGLNQKASQALSSGDSKSAIAACQRAIQLDPSNAKLHYNLALAFDQAGDLTSERRELLRSSSLDTGLALAHNQLGLLALNGGHHREAESEFIKALKIDPKLAEAQNSLGVLYSQQGKGKEAASFFQQAIENDPKFPKAHVNFGLLLAQNGNLAAAEQQFRTALQIDANYADAYAALGMLEAKTGRANEALRNFQKAVDLNPESAQAHLNLGIALVDQFDRGEAFKQFSEAARLDPKLAAAHYNLGRFYFESSKYDDADRELATATRLRPDFSDALYFLALTAKQKNETERATSLFQKTVALQPKNADAQYLLGQQLEHAGDTSGAIQHWKLALEADANHSQALFNLAKVLNKAHDPDAKQYQDRFQALQKNQQITDRVSELGNFALEAANAQNWPQAFLQMKEAIQLCGDCPQSAHLHKNLGIFYERTGNLEEAQKELRAVLQMTPNDVDAQTALAALERAQQAQPK